MSDARPPLLRTCEQFSEQIHLLADRELGPAESALVEQHLLSCPRCATLAGHLERMSSILKAWDVEANAVADVAAHATGAPARRIEHAVLVRVQEQGVRRRRDDRVLRFIHVATAAVILLALGLGVVLGLQEGAARVAGAAAGDGAVIAFDDAPMPLAVRRPHDTGFAAGAPVEPFAAIDLLAGIEVPSLPASEAFGGSTVAKGLTAARWRLAFPHSAGSNAAGRNATGRNATGSNATGSNAPGTGGALVRATDGFPLLVQRVRRHEALEARLGERVTSWNAPRRAPGDLQREHPFVTVSALAWLHEKGYLARWVRAGTPASPTRKPERDVETDTRMTARAMLSPMPGIDRELRLLKERPPIIRTLTTKSAVAAKARKSGERPGAGDLIHLLDGWALPRAPAATDAKTLRSGSEPVASRVRFLDPVAASANGQLSFAESLRGADSVIALVEGTDLPIFIPAGQFLTGGLADRVLAQPVWLPATRGKKPYMISCRVVQKFELGDVRAPLVLQREIAGPTLRALLAAGASPREVREGAERILAALQGETGTLLGDWSLYTVHRGMHARVMAALGETKFRWSDLQGFVVTDARGRFVGSEIVRPGGPAASELLRRLWVSYSLEAGLRQQAREALAGDAARLAKAFAAPRVAPGAILRRLAKHAGTFHLARDVRQPVGARVSSLEVVAAGVALHAVQVAGRPAIVSTLDVYARP